METYKLDTGLVSTNPQSFSSDNDAWNTLRTIIPHKFATLYKRLEMSVPILREKEYKEKYYSKFGTYTKGVFVPTETDPSLVALWMPILVGITDDEF